MTDMISEESKAHNDIVMEVDSDRQPLSRSFSRSPKKVDKGILNAFNTNNSELSRQLHIAKNKSESASVEITIDPNEGHKQYGDYVKSIVYGGLDGIITTFAVVSGVAGADLNVNVILVLGFANLVADGLSMGLGDYLSELAEEEYVKSERAREMWEFENFPEGEIAEMMDIYVRKGVSEDDATIILQAMSKYPDFFVNHMMVQELDIKPPDDEEESEPWKNGLVTMGSFMFFGCVPLLSYLIFATVDFAGSTFDPKFLVSILLTISMLAALGGVKAKMTDSSVCKSMGFVCINGSLAAAASYVIGFGLSQITGIHGAH